jgi:hypothetical protein
MANALNLAITIGQDEFTQARLRALASTFSSTLQPLVDKVFRDSLVIHFARIFVIDNKYLVLVAEYDGPGQEYTEVFRRALGPLFSALFSIAEGVQNSDDMLRDANVFWEATKSFNYRSLGDSVDGHHDLEGKSQGYLFSAYGDRSVTEILSKLD